MTVMFGQQSNANHFNQSAEGHGNGPSLPLNAQGHDFPTLQIGHFDVPVFSHVAAISHQQEQEQGCIDGALPYHGPYPANIASFPVNSRSSPLHQPDLITDKYCNEIITRLCNVKETIEAAVKELQELHYMMQIALVYSNESIYTSSGTILAASASCLEASSTLDELRELTTNITSSALQNDTSAVSSSGVTRRHPEDFFPQLPSVKITHRHGVKYFQCECGHETKRKGDMARHRECLKHSSPSYICPCGEGYTRKDGLKRHRKACKKRI